MYYSSIGIISALTLLIVNYDVLIKDSSKLPHPTQSSYKRFLLCVLGFYISDILWGVFYSLHIIPIAFINTEIYFAVMALSVFLWSQYVIIYLDKKSRFLTMMKYGGWIFLILQAVVLLVNIFIPIAFWFEEDGSYHTNKARYMNMLIQFILFLTTSVYMFAVTISTKGKIKRRHQTIGFFGLAMTIFVVLQAAFPYMPFYSIGYMLSTCILHTFVIEDEKEARREELEKILQVGQIREAELGSARQMAYTDPLTGVKNKNAYLEDVIGIEKRIEDGILKDFALIVFDVNGLKKVNDLKGHDEGDKYIKNASRIICNHFKHCPIYRIGGDEFAAFLMGEELKKHDLLIKNFNTKIERNLADGGITIACGYAEFNERKSENDSYTKIFERADKKMYKRKKELKGKA